MKSIFNRSPLTPNTYAPLSLGSIQPEEWLKEQLELLKNGTAAQALSYLDMEGADWEKSLYVLDGLLPLAWAMDDEPLKQRLTEKVEAILASQNADGWFGPMDVPGYWPRILALRALWQYFTATADRRVLKFMDAFFKYEYRTLGDKPLTEEAVARGGENMYLAMKLYNLTGQAYLPELCRRLRDQTLDWPTFFHAFSITQPMNRSLRHARMMEGLEEEKNELLTGHTRPYFHTQNQTTNAENIAFGLKTPGVINLFKSGFKEQGGFQYGWSKLTKYHGTANGAFTGDRHINGASPTQATDAAVVAELMNSIEDLIACGDYGKELPDILEKLAFNALPAVFSSDMQRMQRMQQGNQVVLSADERPFYNAECSDNRFNMSVDERIAMVVQQAWPKFVASLWYATSDMGLAVNSYAPCTVRTRIGQEPVRLRVSGEYPFSENVSIEVSVRRSMEFPLYLRVPGWVRQPMITLPDGEIMQVRAGEIACIRRLWQSGDVIRLYFNAVPRVTRWHHQSAAVEVGPLLMAFEPEAAVTDDQVRATENWGWALLKDEPMKTVYEPKRARAFGMEDTAVHVLVKAAKIVWPLSGANCAGVPIMPQIDMDQVDTIALVPYGATTLRVSQFPVAALKNDKNK